MKTFKFSLELHTCRNTDVFFTLYENIYSINSQQKSKYSLSIFTCKGPYENFML